MGQQSGSGIAIPAAVAIRATIRPGSVFYFNHASFSSPEPHYHVVLNGNPGSDYLLITVNATTNLEGRKQFIERAGLAPESLVEATPSDCGFLKQDSGFDCNNPTPVTIDELISKLEAEELKLVGEIDDQVLRRLRGAVKGSRMVRDEYKDLIP